MDRECIVQPEETQNLKQMKICDIEEIDLICTKKLNSFGIYTAEDLLIHGAMRSERKRLAEESGIDESKILSWVHLTDLFRIKGIGPQYGRLLRAVGVNTITELRTQRAENLYARIVAVSDDNENTSTIPSLSQIADYINQANELEPVISY